MPRNRIRLWGLSMSTHGQRTKASHMAIIGYARVSTPDQSLDRQLDELRAKGSERVFAEAASGKRGADRPQWEACLAHLRAGDALVVVELSRLGRNTGDLGASSTNSTNAASV